MYAVGFDLLNCWQYKFEIKASKWINDDCCHQVNVIILFKTRNILNCVKLKSKDKDKDVDLLQA